jgi:hypothetical protein
VARILSTVLVLALLMGTAAAFALTEGLKLEKTPVLGTQVDQLFSPVCGPHCRTRRARIFFRLRKAETLTVTIERGSTPIRTLVSHQNRRGPVELFWNGRDDAGEVQPDGTYIPVVHLGRSHRTIRLPNPIELDTRSPQVESVAVRPHVFSPDGDGHGDRIVVRYRFDEHAHAVLLVDGKPRVFTNGQQPEDKLDWNGRLDGHRLRPGSYQIAVAAQDRAGNLGPPKAAGRVQVRYVSLGRTTIRVVAGARFALRVSTDAPTVRWLLAGRTNTAPRGTIKLRAPVQPGRYTLYVSASGHAARATVVVRPGG